MSNVRIEMTGPSTGKVYVDGQEIHQVVAVRFEVDVRKGRDRVSSVEIVQRIVPDSLEIQGQADVTVLDNLGARQYAAV